MVIEPTIADSIFISHRLAVSFFEILDEVSSWRVKLNEQGAKA
jgi:hypothetical protein